MFLEVALAQSLSFKESHKGKGNAAMQRIEGLRGPQRSFVLSPQALSRAECVCGRKKTFRLLQPGDQRTGARRSSESRCHEP